MMFYSVNVMSARRRMCMSVMVFHLLMLVSVVACAESSPNATQQRQATVIQTTLRLYAEKLHDPTFDWPGPTSHEDRIPVLHAARALAYFGDDAVPFLVEAIPDRKIDIYSIYDALSEIGLPVHDFHAEIIDERTTEGIQRWWQENRVGTRTERSRHRQQIGLPPLNDGG